MKKKLLGKLKWILEQTILTLSSIENNDLLSGGMLNGCWMNALTI